MDFRTHVRKPLNMNAVVSFPQLGLVSVRILNISAGGTLVDTGGVSLPRGEKVDICFHLETADKLCTAQAQVVHNSISGAGLKFRSLDVDSRAALGHLLLEVPTVS